MIVVMSIVVQVGEHDGFTKAAIIMFEKAPRPPVGRPLVREINTTAQTVGSLRASTKNKMRSV